MPNESVNISTEFEKISYTITINTNIGFNVNPVSPITVLHGDDKEIIIIAVTGYRLTSVKVDGVEKSSLINNKLILEDVVTNTNTIVTTERIEYDVINEGKTNTVENPKTNDNILYSLLFGNISLIGCIYLKKKI